MFCVWIILGNPSLIISLLFLPSSYVVGFFKRSCWKVRDYFFSTQKKSARKHYLQNKLNPICQWLTWKCWIQCTATCHLPVWLFILSYTCTYLWYCIVVSNVCTFAYSHLVLLQLCLEPFPMHKLNLIPRRTVHYYTLTVYFERVS